ncbi:MAG: hypothetical protein HQM11_06315 [SAR324 cluster bacterium]|nr:hypothetical protein [SAR324 cluster bacterium]
MGVSASSIKISSKTDSIASGLQPSYQVIPEIKPEDFPPIDRVKAEVGAELRGVYEEVSNFFITLTMLDAPDEQMLTILELSGIVTLNPCYLSLLYTIQSTCKDRIPKSSGAFQKILFQGMYLFVNAELQKNEEKIRETHKKLTYLNSKVSSIRAFIGQSKDMLIRYFNDTTVISSENLQQGKQRIEVLNQLLKTLPNYQKVLDKVNTLESKARKVTVISELLISFLTVEETMLHKGQTGHINDYTVQSMDRITSMLRILKTYHSSASSVN